MDTKVKEKEKRKVLKERLISVCAFDALRALNIAAGWPGVSRGCVNGRKEGPGHGTRRDSA